MIKQVALTTGAVVTILTPGSGLRWGVIQNNGANPARLAPDGGSTVSGLQDPTANLGMVLGAGQQVFLSQLYGSDLAGLPGKMPVIRAIASGGATTLDIATTDSTST